MTAHKAAPKTSDDVPSGGDPSMEDILASIRRILSEDETASGPLPEPPSPPPADDVLMLETSMMVPVPDPLKQTPQPDKPPERRPAPEEQTQAIATQAMPTPPPPPRPSEAAGPREGGPAASMLVAPEAAKAAASSVGNLIRTLTADRAVQVHAGGPTLEDMVRAELRPLVKEWLDANLPNIVERLVRAEIERVVGRALP